MSKKLLSTILLFVVFIGCLAGGLSMVFRPDPQNVAESIIFGLMILGCAGYALVSIVLLPRKKQR